MTVWKGSPWIFQLERDRPATVLEDNESADTIVIGGGIAGLATAFYVLRDTDREVVLLEADLVAHGATGHNAGQAVAAMERRFDDIAGELGEEKVAQGYREIQSGWERLEEVLESTGRHGDLLRVRGVAATDSPETAHSLIKEMERWKAVGAARTEVAVVKEMTGPVEGAMEVDADRLADLLGTIDRRYVAALCAPSGVLNATLLTEAMAEHLLSTYPDRFRIYEKSRVRRLRLGDEVAASTERGTVIADNVVLCTNGYLGMGIEACQVPV
ncbi:MAG TPA: FAD-binding oxidoreductase [Euryarchaeota archaeon]|jgi:glycine/D-amino acid oxidase-like deaminating enzyme|nr:FAD-binding oxidoreductase [Euryarchaeota archaeon]